MSHLNETTLSSTITKQKLTSNKELDDLKLVNEALKEKLAKCKINIEKLARENETLTIENHRLQMRTVNTKQERNPINFESKYLFESKIKKEQTDHDTLNELIKRSKEMYELKLETTSLQMRLKEKLDLLKQVEQNSELLREKLDIQTSRLKNIAIKYEINEPGKQTDYIKIIEDILEVSKERSINLRRELAAQKSDFTISLNRFRRKELYYVDEIKRLRALNDKLNLDLKEKNTSNFQIEKKMKVSDSKEDLVRIVKREDLQIVDELNESNDNQSYVI